MKLDRNRLSPTVFTRAQKRGMTQGPYLSQDGSRSTYINLAQIDQVYNEIHTQPILR